MVPLPVPLLALAMTENFEEGARLPRALMWIKDVPLFIDEANLARFYDAVIRPTFRESGPREITVSKEQKEETEGKLKAGGSLHIPSWLTGPTPVGDRSDSNMGSPHLPGPRRPSGTDPFAVSDLITQSRGQPFPSPRVPGDAAVTAVARSSAVE